MKSMMARISERFNKELKGELILNGHRYDVNIENISENGIKVIYESKKTAVDIFSDQRIILEFEIPSGELLSLYCKVQWSSKRSPDSLLENIGLEIIEKSEMFDDFFK